MSDRGLASERTSIAWARTALVAAALGVLLLRLGIVHRSPAEVAAAVVTFSTAALLGWVGRRSHRGAAAARALIAAVSLGVGIAGVLAIVGALN